MANPANRELPFTDPGGWLYNPAFVSETLERSLPRITDPNFIRDTLEGRTDSEVLLNLLTSIGPFPGWWLTPDAPHLSNVERVIASHADNDVLDWLLTLLAASSGISDPGDGVLKHSLEKYEETRSLPWLLAVETARVQAGNTWRLERGNFHIFTKLDKQFSALTQKVRTCEATPAEYTAFSIARFERQKTANRYGRRQKELEQSDFFLLPSILRELSAVSLAKRHIPPRYGRYKMPLDQISKIAGNSAFDSWMNVGRSYNAASIEELISVNKGIPLHFLTKRFLNILSADDMLQFARSRSDFSAEQQLLTTTAFLRYFALGEDQKAAEIVDEMIALWPERNDLMSSKWQRSGTLGYRLASVALALDEPRLIIAPARYSYYRAYWAQPKENDDLSGGKFWSSARRTRDLPLSFRMGGFLRSDYGEWQSTILPSKRIMWQVNRRAYMRGVPIERMSENLFSGAMSDPNFNRFWYIRPGETPANFAGWDELAQLGPETGLTNRIGQEIVRNARYRARSPLTRLLANKEAIALELEMVIWQGRRMIHGNMERQPLGKQAFDILHAKYGNTETAKRVPYWYICRENCVF